MDVRLALKVGDFMENLGGPADFFRIGPVGLNGSRDG